jgi:hypothetical protein
MNSKKTPEEIQYEINVMTTYLQMKVDSKDWHAVWDAAIDLYKLDTEFKLCQS